MEREATAETFRLMRAVRSLAYNRELKPVIEGRIERAETNIRGYMLANSLRTTQIGAFEVEMDEDGDLALSRLPMDEWEQMPLPRVSEFQEEDEEDYLTEEQMFAGIRTEPVVEPQY